MHLLFIISIISALFITTSTAPFLHIKEVVTFSFIPLVAYILVTLFNKPSVWKGKHNTEAYYVILLGIILLILKYGIGQDYFKTILQFIFIPMLISIVFESLCHREVKTLRYIILIFFIAECSLAIYERVTHTNIFYLPSETELLVLSTQEEWAFRSTAFLGHPLINAMAITTILSFILLYKRFSIVQKIILTALGYLSLYCFNARGATIITTITIIPYLFYLINQTKNRRLKRISYLVFFLGGSLFIYYLVNSSLGGRLFNEDKIIDGSAQTRLDVFQFYNFLTTDQLLWGAPDLYYYLMRKLEAGGVENGIVVLIINYGLIPTLFLLPLLIYFHYRKLAIYKKAERIWIMAIFYIIGIMNPNLAVPTQWVIWLFAYYAFRNKKSESTYILNRKNRKQVCIYQFSK